ncbi:hypothetical protein LSTR_LSTR001913 [Laodelphax striatellus]|uniref:Peptidase S1 domain-containing protein n=1 Tax=Laodelphax striatellus TaxID=195883 RepID=A0A482XGS8_LAOST|nr:hypothetical protein LSTR_LSTR001913 [Laodelphax striatellus]
MSEYINTVCIPPQSTVPIFATCTATGWGKDEYGKEGKYQVIMKKVDLPIVPRNVCEAKLRQTRLGKFFRLHESFVCAGGEAGRDTCKGDGGGPLVCPIAGRTRPNTIRQESLLGESSVAPRLLVSMFIRHSSGTGSTKK